LRAGLPIERPAYRHDAVHLCKDTASGRDANSSRKFAQHPDAPSPGPRPLSCLETVAEIGVRGAGGQRLSSKSCHRGARNRTSLTDHRPYRRGDCGKAQSGNEVARFDATTACVLNPLSSVQRPPARRAASRRL
jgi:hypothetical protein